MTNKFKKCNLHLKALKLILHLETVDRYEQEKMMWLTA